MTFVIGSKFRVLDSYMDANHVGKFYVGKVYVVHNCFNGYTETFGESADGYRDVSLCFPNTHLEAADDIPGRCSTCDALTPGRIVCCECKGS
jgi:hypothetical protein